MEDNRVKVEYRDANLGSRANLLTILSRFSIRVTKLVNKNNYYLAFLNDSTDSEKVFSNEVSTALQHSSFKAIVPKELIAKRSVIMRNVDKQLMSHSEEEIKQEIIRCNPWCLTNDVPTLLETFKIGITIVKLVFNSTTAAEIPGKQGVSMFHMHIPGYNISRDKFVRLNTCYSCYKIEDHHTNDCPQKASNPSFKVCSNCSSRGHVYLNCNIDRRHFRCINCDENHETLSMSCSVRKNALKLKKSNTQNKNFSDAVKTSFSPPPINVDFMHKAFSLSILALLKNIENPGTFAQELNSLHQMNGLPMLNLSRYVPPQLSTIQSCFGNDAHARTHSVALNPTAAGVRSGVASFPSPVGEERAASLSPPAVEDQDSTATQWQDSAAALPILGDDGQIDSRRPPIVEELATSAANTSPGLHLASFDDEHVDSHPSHTIELVTTSRAREDQVGSFEHDSDISEEAEFERSEDKTSPEEAQTSPASPALTDMWNTATTETSQAPLATRASRASCANARGGAAVPPRGGPTVAAHGGAKARGGPKAPIRGGGKAARGGPTLPKSGGRDGVKPRARR